METVAPHAGAWIETRPLDGQLPAAGQHVAPHAGAWIETRRYARRPPGRPVAPHAGAWIETPFVHVFLARLGMSHPTRVRGLKLTFCQRGRYEFCRSHPTRVRGLKHGPAGQVRHRQGVAPHAGAWIETASGGKGSPLGRVAPHAGAWIET